MSDSNRFINQSNFSKLGSNILSETSRLTVLLIHFIFDRAYFKYASFIPVYTPLAAVAPVTSGPAAAVRNYFKRPLAGHRGAFQLFRDDIKTPRSTPMTNVSHQGNNIHFLLHNMLFPVQMQLFVTAHMQIQCSTQARIVYSQKD